MIPLIKHYLWAFFFDQNAAKRLLVGLAAMVGSVVTAILVFGLSTIASWDRKTLLQHALFALLTSLTTALPGPALAKPGAASVELQPPRGYAYFPAVMAAVVGVAQAIILGLAFRTMGLSGHGWTLVIAPIGVLQGWALYRALK